MANPFISLITTGIITQPSVFADLPEEADGLPTVVEGGECQGCGRCAAMCPLQAITLGSDAHGTTVTLDRGRCIACRQCVITCPSGTLRDDRGVRTARRSRGELLCSNRPHVTAQQASPQLPFRRSLHIRVVSTGDNASDLELLAGTNAVFDVARFGVHYVASPRFADALLVTGPVARGMHEALLRCYQAMTEPKLVIAVGVSAISGGLFSGEYSEANGVDHLLPVAVYIPGDPPHPLSIIHGILLAMGHAVLNHQQPAASDNA